MMRASWIAVGALAVIGAFFIGLQLLWLLRVDPAWLPYVVQVVGAAFAGIAMTKAAPMRSIREPLAAGALAIVALAVISLALPKAFVLTAARIDARWIVLPVLTCATGLACAAGAWLAGAAGAVPSRVWIAVLSAMTATGAIQLGGRLGFALGVPASIAAVTIEAAILAFLVAAATQAIIAIEAIGAIAIGVAAFVVLAFVSQMAKDTILDLSASLPIVWIVSAALGARMAAQQRASA